MQPGRGVIAFVLPKDPLFSPLLKISTERGPDLLHTEATGHWQECVQSLCMHVHVCVYMHVCVCYLYVHECVCVCV